MSAPLTDFERAKEAIRHMRVVGYISWQQAELALNAIGDDWDATEESIVTYQEWREAEITEKRRECPCCKDGCRKCGQKGWVRA